MGNPCSDFKKFRELTIALVPQLIAVDGKEISKQERIISSQNLDEMLEELEEFIKQEEIRISNMPEEAKKKAYTRSSR